MKRARLPFVLLVLLLAVPAGRDAAPVFGEVTTGAIPWSAVTTRSVSVSSDDRLSPVGMMHMPGHSAAGTARQAQDVARDLALDRLLGEMDRIVARTAVHAGTAAACGETGGSAGRDRPSTVAFTASTASTTVQARHAISTADGASARLASTDDAHRLLLPLLLADAAELARPVPAPERTALPSPEPTVEATAEPTAAPPTPLPTAEPAPLGPTWWADAMPIVRRECTTCHYAGGIGPFPLETFTQAVDMGQAMRFVLEEHVMPPLPAVADGETPLDDPRAMSEADRETLIAWVDGGMLEGDPADAPEVEPEGPDLGPPDLSYDIGFDFTPPSNQLDEYRCFVIDLPFRRDTEVRMVDLEPTNAAIFHHGILYLGTRDDRATVERLDREDRKPGYQCFGGPGFNSQEWVVAEAVGSPTKPYPAGTAKVLPAGSFLVLQLHYNSLNGVGEDRTKVHLWLPDEPVGEAPVDVRLANFWFRMPPGEADFEARVSARVRRGGGAFAAAPPGEIYQVWGHMHLLGASFTLDLKRADGSTQRLLDIPRWDFNWQGVYDLAEPVRIEAGDEVEMTCVWDNSAENQPYVDGRQVSPRTVGWGEGTLDEMCLGGFTVVP